MDTNKILKADILDIIFDNRNKEYGAYELRKNYSKRVRNALSIVVTGILVAVAIPLLASLNDKDVKITLPEIPFTPIDFPTDPPIDPIVPPVEPPTTHVDVDIKVIDNSPPEIVLTVDADEDKKLHSQDELSNNNLGTDEHEGETGIPDDKITPPITGGTGPIENEVETTIETIYDVPNVEQMPEYPGGEDELSRFLSENIKYPEKARIDGTQGRVVVGFVVNKNGEIDELKLKRTIGDGCDEEAMRVIKKMPKWKPAKFNGKPVSVYFDLPIFFSLEDR